MKLSIMMLIVLSLLGCKDSLYDECIKKGIQYYKDIDMYPKLPNGEIADEKVKGMCSNSREAFN